MKLENASAALISIFTTEWINTAQLAISFPSPEVYVKQRVEVLLTVDNSCKIKIDGVHQVDENIWAIYGENTYESPTLQFHNIISDVDELFILVDNIPSDNPRVLIHNVSRVLDKMCNVKLPLQTDFSTLVAVAFLVLNNSRFVDTIRSNISSQAFDYYVSKGVNYIEDAGDIARVASLIYCDEDVYRAIRRINITINQHFKFGK